MQKVIRFVKKLKYEKNFSQNIIIHNIIKLVYDISWYISEYPPTLPTMSVSVSVSVFVLKQYNNNDNIANDILNINPTNIVCEYNLIVVSSFIFSIK